MTLPTMTELDLMAGVLDLARVLGWTRAHFRPGRTAHGWRTAVSGDGVGFPDLVLVRPPRIVVAECKAQTGRTTTAQTRWLSDLAACGLDVYTWRPTDYPDGIAAVLR